MGTMTGRVATLLSPGRLSRALAPESRDAEMSAGESGGMNASAVEVFVRHLMLFSDIVSRQNNRFKAAWLQHTEGYRDYLLVTRNHAIRGPAVNSLIVKLNRSDGSRS